MADWTIGIDIGTSSTRAIAFDRDGLPQVVSQQQSKLTTPHPGWAQVDADDIYTATRTVLADCVTRTKAAGAHVAAMGMSCHMHSLVAVDKGGQPLSPVLLWADTRAREQATWIGQQPDLTDLCMRTGCRLDHPMYPLTKLLWWKQHEPRLFSQASRFLTLKEYILYQMYGEYVVDCSLAGSQGLFCNQAFAWDERLVVDILGLSEAHLSPVVDAFYTLKGLSPSLATELGLDTQTPMVLGCGDGLAANIGCGAFTPDTLVSTIGTSGALRMTSPIPLQDPLRRLWCYPLTREHWVAGGAINNGGLVLDWLKQLVSSVTGEAFWAEGEASWRPEQLASQAPAGCQELLFLPYLTGERSPDWNPLWRGCLFGLAPQHDMPMLVRAAMEGVIFRLASVHDAMVSCLPEQLSFDRVVASGGYTHAPVWMQIQADVFGCDVIRPVNREASALGVAYLAMVQTGQVEMGTPLAAMAQEEVFSPHPEHRALYASQRNRFDTLATSLLPHLSAEV